MKNRILVTGCAGFIGSHLVEKLLSDGFHVIGIDNFDPYYDRSIKEKNLLIASLHESFDFFEVDFTNLSKLITLPEFDVVVHLGAKAGVRPSIENPAAYIETNIIGLQNILKLMEIRGKNRLVFASSSSVYGNNEKIPFSENDNVDNPISPYAFTKKSGELLNHYYHHHLGFDIINLRFFTVFGERQRPDLAIHKFVKMALSNVPITIYGDGSTSRDYTYVLDTVSGISKAINYLENNSNVYEIINIGNKKPLELRKLVEIIYQELGISPNLTHLPMQPGDVERTFADTEKAKKIIGFEAKTDFRTGIQNFIKWYKSTISS